MKKLLITITMLFMITGCEDKDAGSSMTKTLINLLPQAYEFYAVVDGVNYTVYLPGSQTTTFTFDCKSSPCDFDSYSLEGSSAFICSDSIINGQPDYLGDTIYIGYYSSYVHLYNQGEAPKEYFCPSIRPTLDCSGVLFSIWANNVSGYTSLFSNTSETVMEIRNETNAVFNIYDVSQNEASDIENLVRNSNHGSYPEVLLPPNKSTYILKPVNHTYPHHIGINQMTQEQLNNYTFPIAVECEFTSENIGSYSHSMYDENTLVISEN
jgi:hypothetical protein